MTVVKISHMCCDEIVQLYQETEKTLDKLTRDIVQLLDKSKDKIAVAESCTGGLLSQCITAVPGASGVYELGLCTYANRTKHELLSVPEELLEQFGAVSVQTAQAMTEGLRTLSGATLCCSTTGLAGPGGGTPECPVGTVYTAVSYRDRCITARLPIHELLPSPNREEIRHAAAICVFAIARKLLMEEATCRN